MTLADGCFDPLHIGHIRYLQAAAWYGRPLVVRVAPDDEIRAKGREPFQTCEERREMITALGLADGVVIFPTLAHAIRELCPKTLVKGDDWRGLLPVDVVDACEACWTRIAYTETRSLTSTDRLAR